MVKANTNATAVALRPLTTDLAAVTTGKGASTIGIEDAATIITATTVEGALAEIMVKANTNATAIGLRPLTTDLAATTVGKGASLIGIQDAAGIITATTVEGALAELATAQALRATIADLISTAAGKGAAMIGVPDGGGYFTAGGWNANVDLALQKTYSDMAPKTRLAAVTTGDGASLIGIEDAANLIAATTVEGVFTALANGSFIAAKSLVSIVDATLTAPDGVVYKHQTSATVVAGSAVGFTTAVELQTTATGSAGVHRGMTDSTYWTTATSGAEASQRLISMYLGGSAVKVAGFGFSAATYPMLFLGDPGNNDGFRRVTAGGRIDLMIAGAAYWAFGLTSECFGHVVVDGNHSVTGVVTATGNVVANARLLKHRGAAVASATTLTLGADGNDFSITGTTTVKGIVTTGWNPGSRITLGLASGITINHADAAPGTNAVAILLRAAVNLTTAAVYMLDLVYNGTNWVQPG